MHYQSNVFIIVDSTTLGILLDNQFKLLGKYFLNTTCHGTVLF